MMRTRLERASLEADIMDIVTVSPKFQIVVPKKARDAFRMKPGQKLKVIVIGDHLHLVPVKPIKAYRGFLKGIDTSVPRGADREL
jgi:AbrB family looped-hinge helix DNA binding protein